MSIKLECSNCRMEIELPDNCSVSRLYQEASNFHKKHKTRIGNVWCKFSNVFIRSFAVEAKSEWQKKYEKNK